MKEGRMEAGVERGEGLEGNMRLDQMPKAEEGEQGGTLTLAASREMVRFFTLPIPFRLFSTRHS